MANLPRIQPELVLKHIFSDAIFEYTERDVALYALGVGAAGDNPVDPLELPLVHSECPRSIKVLPTFAVLYPHFSILDILHSIDGMHYDEKLLLHGEQCIEIYKPLPTRAQFFGVGDQPKGWALKTFHELISEIRSSVRLSGLHDKGKAAIVEVEVLSHDVKTEDRLSLNRYTIFLRSAGGFSQPSKPFSYSARTTNLPKTSADPKASTSAQTEGAPEFVYDNQTQPSQALVYRLSGDYNLIHSDPVVAAEAGFQKPILHGMCTMGYAVRAVIRNCCNGDPTRVQCVQGRFLSHVCPGQKLTTEMWLDASKSMVTYKTKADGKNVLAGTVLLTPCQSRL